MTTRSYKKTIYHLVNILRHEKPTGIFLFIRYAISYISMKIFLPNKRYASRKIHGSRMILDLKDPGISRSLYLLGDREREHYFLLKKAIRPHQRILDIGANIGYYVLIEHRLLQEKGHVIAFEPSSKNFTLLKKNINLNKLSSKTTLLHTALATKDGFSRLHLSRLANVHSLIKKNTDSPTGHSIPVPATSLETTLEKYGPINLIRMDIEGYEHLVLKSLIKINQTKNFTPHIVIELHPPKYNKTKFRQTIKELYRLGYQAKYVACSHLDLLQKHNLTIVKSIPTDGTVRHIAQNVELRLLNKIIFSSRAILFSTKNSLVP